MLIKKHRFSPRHHSDRTRYVAWLAADRYSEMRVTGEDCRTCLLEGCKRVFDTQEDMLLHSYDCAFFSPSGRYLCPCGTPINLKCDRKERLINTLWRFLSAVGRMRSNGRSVRLPSGSFNYPSSIGSRAGPENPLDYQHPTELYTHYWSPIPEPSSNHAELKGTTLWGSFEVEAPAGISELPSVMQYPETLVNCKAGRCHSYCFSMNQSSLMDIQQTDLTTDHVRTRDSTTLVSGNDIPPQQLSRGQPPSYSSAQASPFLPSYEQRTLNDMDFASSQSSWTSSNVSGRQGRSFDSDSSYPPEKSPFLSTQTASQGCHEDPNGTQPSEDLSLDDVFDPPHITRVDTVPECEESFGQGTHLNSEESIDTSDEELHQLIFEQIYHKQYTQEEIDAAMNMDGHFPDHSPLSLIDDKSCRPEHGHSCLTCIISRTLSKFWKSSIHLMDVFMTAYIIVLKDIQSKLPGIDAVKSLPKLEYIFTNPAACLERGLNVFRDIQKEGRKPGTIEDVFAFLTIVYASAVTLHNDSNFTMLNMEMLFQEALCWLAGVGELHQQEWNVNVIKNIWQPRCGGASVPSTVEGSRSPTSLNMMENNCVKIFQDILDGMFCLYAITFVYFMLTV
jgi:hypothetical protein